MDLLEKCHRYINYRKAAIVFVSCYIWLVLYMVFYVRHDSADSVIGWPAHNEEEFIPKRPPTNNPTGCPYNIEEVNQPKFTSLNGDIHLLSAFIDNRTAGATDIKILAILRRDFYGHLYCHIKLSLRRYVVIAVEKTDFYDNRSTDYAGYMLSCKVEGLLHKNPCKVHISTSDKHDFSDSSQIIPIIPIMQRENKQKFAICLPPINGLVMVNRLVEFFELSKLLGAEHVYYYVYTGDSKKNHSDLHTEKVLEYYESQKLVSRFDWKLPVPLDSIRDHGQLLTMHHCLYLSAYKHEYLFYNHLDEFIIPRTMSNWQLMFESADSGNTGSFEFNSVYFPPEVGESLITIKSQKRTSDIDTNRKIYAVKPEMVQELGYESVRKWAVPDVHISPVSSDTALAHHYRFCDHVAGFQCQDYIDDMIMLRYEQLLRENFKKAMKEILGRSAGAADEDHL